MTHGLCELDAAGCLLSPGYPAQLELQSECTIEISDDWDNGSLDLVEWQAGADSHFYVDDFLFLWKFSCAGF